jgi:hypothetical protein
VKRLTIPKDSENLEDPEHSDSAGCSKKCEKTTAHTSAKIQKVHRRLADFNEDVVLCELA